MTREFMKNQQNGTSTNFPNLPSQGVNGGLGGFPGLGAFGGFQPQQVQPQNSSPQMPMMPMYNPFMMGMGQSMPNNQSNPFQSFLNQTAFQAQQAPNQGSNKEMPI